RRWCSASHRERNAPMLRTPGRVHPSEGSQDMVQSQRILLIDTEEVIPGVTKLNLRGRLDAPGAQIIDNTFATMAGAQERLIVDLSRVSFIASAGLRTLISGAR